MSTPNPLSAESPHVDQSLVSYTHVIYEIGRASCRERV